MIQPTRRSDLIGCVDVVEQHDMSDAVSSPRVLVVDDEENIRYLVESALQLKGITTHG